MNTFQSTGREDNKEVLKNRAVTLLILLFIILLISFIQIFRLIVLERDAYLTSSEENRITILPIYSSRGLIRLSNEELISENVVFHNLVISLGNKSISSIKKAIEGIGLALDIEKTRIKEIKNKIYLNKKSKQMTLIENLSSEQIEKYLFYREKWPSIKLEAELRRFLIDSALFSHVVGYLGRINADELEEAEELLLFSESWVGKTGLEKQYEETLRGSFGYRTVEVDVYGNEVRELRRIKPSTANTIYLSLDKNLQRLAKKELKGRRGAIIAIDPNNGLVRALVSSPDFNPNVLNQSEKGNFTEIASDPDGPFFNRVISGNYPPASTIKPFIGLLGLQEGVIDWGTIVEDPGFFQINAEGRKYRGSREEGHGSVNLSKAIIESSDVYFYELATQLSVDKIYSFLDSFGLSNMTGIDIYGEGKGILPNRKWKLGAVGQSWYVGDTVNLGIGQGYITVTPLQLAIAISALANKGKVFRPRVVERINDEFTSPEVLFTVSLSDKSNWKKMEEAMVGVIESWNGTAHNLFAEGQQSIAGKTGTAQIKSLSEGKLTVKEEYEKVRKDEKKRDHALFVSYGPLPNPKLVVVVVIENGESGSTVAAPIAKKMIASFISESR